VTIVPLETVRGVYEKLSREAVEAQKTRPLPGQRSIQHNGYQGNATGDLQETGPDDATAAGDGMKGVVERTKQEGQQNGRAISAPTTPLHRPPLATADRDVTGTDRDVTDDELPHPGITQALVAQWRQLEERARADHVRASLSAVGTTLRSRSLSGLALQNQRGDSPSPSRRTAAGPQQARSDGGAAWKDICLHHDEQEEDTDMDEQGRSGAVQRQGAVDAVDALRRDVVGLQDTTGGNDESGGQLPPPLLTQYMLAKFRDLEAGTQIIAGLQTKDRKVIQSPAQHHSLQCTDT